MKPINKYLVNKHIKHADVIKQFNTFRDIAPGDICIMNWRRKGESYIGKCVRTGKSNKTACAFLIEFNLNDFRAGKHVDIYQDDFKPTMGVDIIGDTNGYEDEVKLLNEFCEKYKEDIEDLPDKFCTIGSYSATCNEFVLNDEWVYYAKS